MRPFSVILFLFVFLVFLIATDNYMVLSQRLSRYADEQLVWDCNFEVDSCHFRNQHNLAKYNRYYNAMNPLFGRAGLLLLNIKSQRQRYPGARLISHYFPSSNPQACLFVSYYSTGDSPQEFFVIQQDKENKCIFADHNLQSKSDRWNQIEIQLDLSDGDPRFFLETHFDQYKTGYFAIGSFKFGIGECRRPEVNRC